MVESPLADFGTVREIFLLSMRTKSITENFFFSEKYVYSCFCNNSTHREFGCTTVRPYKVLLITCVVNCTAGTRTPRLCPVVSALGSESSWLGQGDEPLRSAGKKKRAPLLGLAKSIYYTVNCRYGILFSS